jgi:hypothetical protein
MSVATIFCIIYPFKELVIKIGKKKDVVYLLLFFKTIALTIMTIAAAATIALTSIGEIPACPLYCDDCDEVAVEVGSDEPSPEPIG